MENKWTTMDTGVVNQKGYWSIMHAYWCHIWKGLLDLPYSAQQCIDNASYMKTDRQTGTLGVEKSAMLTTALCMHVVVMYV